MRQAGVSMGIRMLLVLLTLFGGVSCGRTDAERAALEREAYQKRIEKSSTALAPYRLIKLAIRAEAAQEKPKELEEIANHLQRLDDNRDKKGVVAELQDYANLSAALLKAHHLLNRYDEDAFPLMWTALTKDPLPTPYYDKGFEHFCLGLGWTFLNTAPFRGKALDSSTLVSFAAYEQARAKPGPAWPPEWATLAHLARGLEYYASEYHYAADEELTGYLNEVSKLRPEQLTLFESVIPGETQASLLSAGHLLRGFNRMALGRDESAGEDMEAALQLTARLLGDTELTLWTSAFVAYQKKNYSEAGRHLEKLADSPYLASITRESLRKEAEQLQKSGKKPGIFRKGRAGLLMLRAVVARAGGIERLLEKLFGAPTAERLMRPAKIMTGLEQTYKNTGTAVVEQGKGFWVWVKTLLKDEKKR